MTEEQKKHFKELLEKEKVELEAQLATVGHINPNNPKDWEASPAEMGEAPTDPNEVADTIEEFENNTAILKQLEIRYNEVLHALKKFDNDTYGMCEVSKEPIDIQRLEANPAARTMIEHAGKESSLT